MNGDKNGNRVKPDNSNMMDDDENDAIVAKDSDVDNVPD
jgi:hypothetical protein